MAFKLLKKIFRKKGQAAGSPTNDLSSSTSAAKSYDYETPARRTWNWECPECGPGNGIYFSLETAKKCADKHLLEVHGIVNLTKSATKQE